MSCNTKSQEHTERFNVWWWRVEKKTQTQSCTQLLSLLYIWKCSMKTAAYRFCRVGVLRVRKGSTSSYLLPEEANTAFFAPSKLRHTSSFSLAGVNQPRQGDALYCVKFFRENRDPRRCSMMIFKYIFCVVINFLPESIDSWEIRSPSKCKADFRSAKFSGFFYI